MGYNLHISRRDEWYTPVPNDITYAEWKRLANADPDFEVCGHASWRVDVFLREEGKPEPEPQEDVIETYDCYGLKTSESYASFGYHDGRVVVRVPHDAVTARKIMEVAGKLHAVVQGDEGEYYRLADDNLEPMQERP
jgi:hypothetical protein